MGAELRLGRQVVSWGESTFIQNGINVINHFDVSALRVPGSELKEAFLPQEMVNFSLQFNDNLSAQAIYITDWNATVPEPAGSYFSNNDFAPTGGSKVVLGFGSFSDQGVDFRPLGGPYITNFQTVNRLPTHQGFRRRPVRLQPQVLRAGLQQRHGIRPLLPELPQPPAADLRPDRHASRASAMRSAR